MRRLAGALVLTAALVAGCSEDPAPTPSADPSESESSSPTPTPTESPSATESAPTEEPSQEPTEDPGATLALLDWKPVKGPVDDPVTVSGPWRLTRAADGSSAQLSGPAGATYEPPAGYRYSDTLLDGQYAVVVAEHQQESRPSIAEVVDLGSGRVTTLDGRSNPPTTTGGSWDLGSGLLTHATTRRGDYCLAVVDLLADRGQLGPCVPPRHGFNNVTTTPAGTSAMTFDDSRPSCRTLNRVEGGSFQPIGGVTECIGWDSAVTEISAIWSQIPNEKNVERADFFTDTGGGPTDLGPGTSGTLTWCGDAAYFVRDPQRSSDPARLIRVREGQAEVVYESPGTGNAFIGEPRCGGTDLTLSALSSGGDEQVTVSLR